MIRSKIIYKIGYTLTCFSAFAFTILQVQDKSTNWLYLKPGWLDEWIYLNYFFDLGTDSGWNNYYKASRVPYNFIGFVGFKFLGYEIYLESLHWIYLFILAITVGLMTKFFLSLPYVFVLTFLLSLNPEFHGSGGWFYQNTISLLLIGISYVLITKLIKSRGSGLTGVGQKKSLFISFLLLLIVSVHLLIVNTMHLLAMIPIFILLVFYPQDRKFFNLGLLAFWSGIASILTFAFWSIISHSTGFRFKFWEPLLNIFLEYSSGSHEVWSKSFGSYWWLEQNYSYISVMFSATLWSFFYLLLQIKKFSLSIENFFFLLKTDLIFLVSYFAFSTNLIWFSCYFLNLHILEYDYHALPSIFASFLLIFCVFVRYLQRSLKSKGFLYKFFIFIQPVIALGVSYYLLTNNVSISLPYNNSISLSVFLLVNMMFWRFISGFEFNQYPLFYTVSVLVLLWLSFFYSIDTVYAKHSPKYRSSNCEITKEASLAVINWNLSIRNRGSIFVFYDPKDNIYQNTVCSYPSEYLANSLVETGKFKLSFPMGNNPGLYQSIDSGLETIAILTSNNYEILNLEKYLTRLGYVRLTHLPGIDSDGNGAYPILHLYSTRP